jgi:hypothetical protein
VVNKIWLFIEGGGGKQSRDDLRRAFGEFFSGPREAARERGIHWRVVMCGSRDDTFKAFRAGVRDYPEDHVFLLVDAEQEVACAPRAHLAARDPWDLSFASDDQCHLMAQVMESWFLADPDALAQFYGSQFGIKQIPPRKNVEEVPKSEVETVLKSSTAKTSKGEYHKIRHGAPILESLNADRVRSRAPHCDRLFEALQEAIG